jgi:hypothetical protein
MPWTAETAYTARFELPTELEQGRDNAVSCPVFRSGSLVAPDSGTVSLFNSSGTAVVDAATVTITGNTATYTIPSATLSGQSRSEGWRIEWVLTMPDGTVRTLDNEAMMVRRSLFPVVTESDLYRRASSLDPDSPHCITSETDFADKLDESWVTIMGRLLALGRRPHLILSPSALREVHLTHTLALIFEDLSARNADQYSETARMYREQQAAAWQDMRFQYDESDDDGRTVDTTRKSPMTSMWLGSVR